MSLLNMFKRKAQPPTGSRESNDEVRAVLASMGDDGSAIRHVLHYAYPGDAAQADERVAIIEALKTRGMEVSDAAAAGGLVMEHYREVASDDFDALTGALYDWFAKRGWDYDGWECALEAGEENVH